MTVTFEAKRSGRLGGLGPLCIACGNKRRFWVEGVRGEQLVEIASLPPGEVHIAACGRCRSYHSVVITHID